MRSPASPLVSVVMPAYNAERTIARTISSVLAQTYTNLEVVVVDDGSTDATREIAESFARRDPRLRVLRKENEGVARARNFGMQAARSELIAPVDADDLWHTSKIEKQVAALLAAGEDTAFVYALFRVIDERDMVLRSSPVYRMRGRVLCQHVLVNFVGNGSAMLLRRAAALEFGGYDASLQGRGAQGCEDLLLQLRMASRYHVEVVPEYLVGYRRHSQSMSADLQRMARSYVLAFDDLRREYRQVPQPTFDWGTAPFIMDQAIGAIRRGRPLHALKLSSRAVQRDVIGALAHLTARVRDQALAAGTSGLRVLRAAFGRASGDAPTAQVRRPFDEYEPTEAMAPWPPNKLLERRLKQLERIDGSLAGNERVATAGRPG
jgi:glycosyltransferase involved in cell wall biosynthesis